VSASRAPPSVAASWALLRAGAADVVSWGSKTSAAEIAARLARWDEVDDLVASPLVRDRLIGESVRWRSLVRRIVEVARFTDSPVLVTGETGTGKELVARLVHDLDARTPKRALILLDCTTIVPTLSGSEFFGHERGAFTGAVATRDGAFALADGGTLFLDEVGELPLGLQAELLRVVQEGTYKRVGSNTWLDTRFRLVCATNRDLREHAGKDAFRWDFYYRIAGHAIRLPSLRERVADIIPLVRYFLRELTPAREEPPDLDPAVRDFLVSREYPGNVRDLRQLVIRITSRHVGPGPITLGDLPEDERSAAGAASQPWQDESFESAIRALLARGLTLDRLASTAKETAVRIAIDEAGNNLPRAAARLGVTARALQQRRKDARESENGSTANGEA
jgi:transcriptional regulator with GAF, ATPase, and Fis domain